MNSPYVESLLKHMSPDVDIKTVFARVQDDLRKSKWAQRPDTSDQLGDKKVAFAPEAPPPPVGTVFRDCAECLEMKVLSAGRFQMGDDKSDPEHDKTALPQHVVAVKKPFAIGTTPVTWSQWEACVKSGSCGQQRLEQYNKEEANYWSNRPVTNIDWRDARDYAIWLGRRTTKKYRLLSEAEFEYAARAGTTTAYWWGTKASHDYANYGTGYSGLIEGRDKWKFTSPVGSFPANPFGLYDMNGNVAQYVQDCLNPSYSGAPADGSAWEKELCDFHVLRGGGWDDGPRGIRSASRVRSGYEGGRRFVGFRVARTL